MGRRCLPGPAALFPNDAPVIDLRDGRPLHRYVSLSGRRDYRCLCVAAQVQSRYRGRGCRNCAIRILQRRARHLGRKPVHGDELERAKNMLKCNVLMQLESRLVLFEDLSRQLLTYNRHETMRDTAARIEAVTASDCQDLVSRSLCQNPPSLASVGMDLSKVPRADEIKAWFQ